MCMCWRVGVEVSMSAGRTKYEPIFIDSYIVSGCYCNHHYIVDVSRLRLIVIVVVVIVVVVSERKKKLISTKFLSIHC